MERKGYVMHVSPTKRSRTKDFPYFTFTLQTGSQAKQRVVCYDSKKEREVKNYSESGQPLKLLNVSQKESLLVPDEMDVIFTKRSKLEPASNSEIGFECAQTDGNGNQTTTIKEVLSLAENSVVANITGRLRFKENTIVPITVRGRKMDMMEQCILTDETGSIKITLWDNLTKTVEDEECYHFTNVRVKQFDGKKYLTTTSDTVLTVEHLGNFPTMSDDDFHAFFQIGTMVVDSIELVADFKKQYVCKRCRKSITEVTSSAVTIMKCKVCDTTQNLSTCRISTSVRIAVPNEDDTSNMLWFTLFDEHLTKILNSDPLEEGEVSQALLELKNFSIEYDTESLSIKKLTL